MLVMGKIKTKEILSADTQKTLTESNSSVNFNKLKKEKYSKKEFTIDRGFDLLERLIIVRPYIQKKYDLTIDLLELLLYLHGKKLFTQADFAEIPKQFSYASIRNILDTGHVVIAQEGVDLSKHVYKLSVHATHGIEDFYELLSGEKKFPEYTLMNPLSKKRDAAAIDKKRMRLIKKINLLPPPEKHKNLYL